MDKAVCTIISKNYLPQARTLFKSLAARHPGIPFYVLLVDRLDGYFEPGRESFKVVALDQLEIPNLPAMSFQYNILEFNTAVKPYLLRYLFKTTGAQKLIYLDPDIFVYRPLDLIFGLLDTNNAVVIPHLLNLDIEKQDPMEIIVMQCGTYNLGFIALRQSGVTDKFLKWWCRRMENGCFSAPSEGLFVDQKWVDLAVGMYEKFYILQEPGYNVAYWGLRQRAISRASGGYEADGKPLVFFHFSGYDPHKPRTISKYDPENTELLPGSALEEIFEGYRKELVQNGLEVCEKWPYAFGSFANGAKITPEMRRYYALHKHEKEIFLNRPFDTEAPDSFYQSYLRQNGAARDWKTYAAVIRYHLQRLISKTAFKILLRGKR